MSISANCAGNLYRVIAPKTGVVQPIKRNKIKERTASVKIIPRSVSDSFRRLIKAITRNPKISQTSAKDKNFKLLPGSFGKGRRMLLVNASGILRTNCLELSIIGVVSIKLMQPSVK